MAAASSPEVLRGISDAALAVFAKAGASQVAPDIIQPADPFLDRLGEQIRGRTYVFTDPGGEELCLRPDLTLPVARIYMRRHPECTTKCRFSYSGPAFRFQPGPQSGLSSDHPREFEQVGIECYGGEDREAAEASLTGITARALEAAGIARMELSLGDPGLFHALLNRIDMPRRWRRRLLHQFWRPEAFRVLLHSLGQGGAAARGEAREKDLLAGLAGMKLEEVAARVEASLTAKGIPLVGGRRVEDIAERLQEHAADQAAEPLYEDRVRLIESYLQVAGKPRACLERIAVLTEEAGLDLGAELEAFARRLDLLEEEGFVLDEASFSAEFGRQFEYYSGFVFQLTAPGGVVDGPLAGGGRYDGLLSDLGAPVPVPAVGSAMHSERIATAREATAS